jgi:hypothetical protein
VNPVLKRATYAGQCSCRERWQTKSFSCRSFSGSKEAVLANLASDSLVGELSFSVQWTEGPSIICSASQNHCRHLLVKPKLRTFQGQRTGMKWYTSVKRIQDRILHLSNLINRPANWWQCVRLAGLALLNRENLGFGTSFHFPDQQTSNLVAVRLAILAVFYKAHRNLLSHRQCQFFAQIPVKQCPNKTSF